MVISCYKLNQPDSDQLLEIMLSRLTKEFAKILDSLIG